jgi:hypothetical protein
MIITQHSLTRLGARPSHICFHCPSHPSHPPIAHTNGVYGNYYTRKRPKYPHAFHAMPCAFCTPAVRVSVCKRRKNLVAMQVKGQKN